MRLQIVHHYQGLRSHYLHGDVLRWCILMVLPHNRESRSPRPLSTLEAGKLYYLSISKKITLLDQVSQAGRSSDLTRADHRGREALQSCSSCCLVSASFGGGGASSTWSNSCSNLSRMLQRVRNEGGGGGIHLWVSSTLSPEFFGKTSIWNQSAQEQVMSYDDVSGQEVHSTSSLSPYLCTHAVHWDYIKCLNYNLLWIVILTAVIQMNDLKAIM